MPYVISKACTKCTACLSECPTGSIIEGTTQYYIDADTCMDHQTCVAVCPVNAISLRPAALAKQSVPNKTEAPKKNPPHAKPQKK